MRVRNIEVRVARIENTRAKIVKARNIGAIIIGVRNVKVKIAAIENVKSKVVKTEVITIEVVRVGVTGARIIEAEVVEAGVVRVRQRISIAKYDQAGYCRLFYLIRFWIGLILITFVNIPGMSSIYGPKNNISDIYSGLGICHNSFMDIILTFYLARFNCHLIRNSIVGINISRASYTKIIWYMIYKSITKPDIEWKQ